MKRSTEERERDKVISVIFFSVLLIVMTAMIIFKKDGKNLPNISSAALDDKIDITTVREIRVRNNKDNMDKVQKIIDNDNVNILFRMMYEDTQTNEIVLEPIVDSEELNELIKTVDTVDKFNRLIEDYIFDSSPIYNSPIVNSSNKINCYGYTLLTMSFIDTHMSDKYRYEIIQDHELPHVYLNLFDNQNGDFITKIDLTVQDKLRMVK